MVEVMTHLLVCDLEQVGVEEAHGGVGEGEGGRGAGVVVLQQLEQAGECHGRTHHQLACHIGGGGEGEGSWSVTRGGSNI